MISTRWRLALVAKALLLLAIAGGFFAIAWTSAHQPSWLLKALGGVGCAALGAFVTWAAGLGLADAALGKARTEASVAVLKSRRQGNSMRTPGGRYVEFILWNPWAPLDPQATYTVTYGRYSGVIVAPPVADAGGAR